MFSPTLVRVAINLGDNEDTYIVRDVEVPRLVKATVQLHHHPGVNPHNNADTTPVTKISVSSPLRSSKGLEPTGPFWWSTPGLKRNGSPFGAQIWNGTKKEEALPYEVAWESTTGFVGPLALPIGGVRGFINTLQIFLNRFWNPYRKS